MSSICTMVLIENDGEFEVKLFGHKGPALDVAQAVVRGLKHSFEEAAEADAADAAGAGAAE